MKNINTNLKQVTKSVQRLNCENKTINEKKKEKSERTCIVHKPMDKDIRNSGDIRRRINKDFPGIIIRNARTTVGGSILLELDDKKSADEVISKWNNNMLGVNSGINRISESQAAGIIKHVYLEESEEDLISEIEKNYPNTKCELFKKSNGLFTGTIKLIFKDDETLQSAITNRLSIFQQRYIVELFKSKPRVIKCNYCQRIGHISRICRSKKTQCGKCSSNEHETKDCKTSSINYKCAHCDGNHITGDKECEVMKLKLEEIMNRIQDDY